MMFKEVKKRLVNRNFLIVIALVGISHWLGHAVLFGTVYTSVGIFMLLVLAVSYLFGIDFFKE